MSIVIPYGIRLSADGRIETLPVAEIKVQRTNDARFFFGIFLVDSGATTTFLPATDAVALGLTLALGKKVLVRGITGRPLIGYRHDVVLTIQDTAIERVPVIFAKRHDTPRVLGREGVFGRFGILFDEARRRTALLDVRKDRPRIDAAFA